jgi:dTDP-glucose pyrophosphorylase
MNAIIQHENWRKTLIVSESTIKEAIDSLEKSGMQVLLVVSEDRKLIGTITDGDIRRALLKGLELRSTISGVMHRNPLAVPPEMGREHILQLMQINKVHQLPIVDQDGLVLGLHVWDTIMEPKIINNMMIIMAGGRGSRLGQYTQNCPKPMLELGGKPILQHIIERAKANGFKKFVISLHYLSDIVEEFFGDGGSFDVRIGYIREHSPLGTAGCLSLLESSSDLPFVVTNGDVLTHISYSEILDYHVRYEASATMAVRQHEIQNQFGTVLTKGVDIEGFDEKPVYRSHVNAGVYVLEPDVLKYLEYNQHCDMPTLFDRIKKNSRRTVVYPMHEPWLDVGRPEDLVNARNIIK